MFITEDEIYLLSHKPVKERLTLLLRSNASGDLKLKPMLLYHSYNSRVLMQQKVIRSDLGVFQNANHKAWVTRKLFYEWASEVLCPSLKSYLTKNKMETEGSFTSR
jgi:hypothetical protein